MEGLLNRAADGSARGIGRWYALAHAARCTPCRKFLENLQTIVDALHRGKSSPSPEVVSRLAAIVHENAT